MRTLRAVGGAPDRFGHQGIHAPRPRTIAPDSSLIARRTSRESIPAAPPKILGFPSSLVLLLGVAAPAGCTSPQADGGRPEDASADVGPRMTATAVSAGYMASCAILDTAQVRCWGWNDHGQLGDGTTDRSSEPVTVFGISNAKAVSVGDNYACALLGDGSLQCWGDNQSGQLGNGTIESSLLPVTVSGITGVVAVSTSESYLTSTCAVLTDGSAWCWGDNARGQLGDGTTTQSLVPIQVPGISGAVAIATGGSHTCVLLDDSTVSCWGGNEHGELGDGMATTAPRTTPGTVTGVTNAVAITAGYQFGCAAFADSITQCWGDNRVGQLGNRSFDHPSPTPVAVSGARSAVSIASGGEHTCAVLTTGAVQCWGGNAGGQLGNGKSGTNFSVAVDVIGIKNAVQVSAGASHTCAVLTTGSVECWGATVKSPTPVTVPGF